MWYVCLLLSELCVYAAFFYPRVCTFSLIFCHFGVACVVLAVLLPIYCSDMPALYLSTPTHHKYNLCLVVHSNDFFFAPCSFALCLAVFSLHLNSRCVLFRLRTCNISIVCVDRLMRRRISLVHSFSLFSGFYTSQFHYFIIISFF